ncbi:hypothetical protein BDN70DRAFT_975195 [Pholiota conissans]|uniref:Cytochrome P450 n=1 Tax=Pholiota conissans TaxID=109636 RepID=A0A9P6D2E4_9AGAR|nr:hypothetical protein BDN70DRAFT_975195 [Pholiota conissans]
MYSSSLQLCSSVKTMPMTLIPISFFLFFFFFWQACNHYGHILSRIQNILQAPGCSIQTLLTERAQANKRLVRALGLSNTFVSDEQDVHTTFVAHAQRLLNTTKKNGWAHFQSTARHAVRWNISKSESELNSDNLVCNPPSANIDSDTFEFDRAIRNITLYVVLQGVLQIDDVESSSYEDIDVVATSITKLWALSKKPEPIPPHLLADLNARLRRLVPDEDVFPAPLDFVVPTWETLWRVVATTVAYSHGSSKIQEAFQAFNTHPRDDTYRKIGEDGGVSVKSVVAEALRLNPPSKRIARAKAPWWCPSFFAAWVSRVVVKADVEALLCCDIWGPDVGSFRPARHDNADEKREAMALVFGHGTLRCIAASWAPMAAAVIAGVVLDEYEVLPGKDIGEREGWEGWQLKSSM